MQKARKQLFATLKSVASNEFVTFVQEQATTAEKLEELFDGIPAKDHPELGDLLNKYVTSVITISKDNAAEEESDKENSRRRSNNADDDDEKKFSKKEVAAIRSASRVVTAFVKNSKRIAPESVYTTVCTLHDLLLVLGDDNRALQADICELCELWYHQQRDGREALVPQTIYYLVCKTLDDESPKVADLKRLYALKEGLSLIDFAAPSSVALKQLLQRCVVHPFFLMKDEGKKLLSYLFTISAPLVDELHRTIKSGITTAKKSQLDAFAEIYLRAWKSAQGACLVRIEHNCLQDLIHHSIHVKNTRILKAVQHILARIVEEKVRIKQLDDLLTRLYEPIIWRSLKVANPRVRCNAAIQLGYVFPLLPANLPPRLMQEQLEEQLEHVKQLQNDPVPLVRVKGVLATGRILSLYWELVPTVYQSSLLLHLIDELAFDASDYRVREAVFQALRLVLDNHLSHGFLKAHLPRLAVLMHDSSEKVRLAFVLLLNEIKRIKAIKFWEVVPIDHLLARLREESLHSLQDGAALTSVESSKVVEGLVALLSDTYFPVKKPASQWVIRCIALVEADHMAALEFFRALAPQLVPSIAVKFIGKLFKKILVPWYKLKVTGVASKPSNDDASEVGEDDQEPNAKRAKTTEVSLSAQDSDTATALTEIIVTILEPVSGQLQEKEHQPLYKILTDVVDDSALLMATKAAEKTSPKMLTAVWTIARHMPVENCPKLLKHVTALVTKNISSDTDSTAGASRAALRLLTSWGKTASILGRMTDKLNNSTIDHVIADAELRDWLLHEDQIQELIVALHEQWTSAIEASLESRETDEEDANSALRLMTTYWRLLVHVAGTASQEIPSFGDFVDWTEEHVISFTEKRQSRTLQHMVERVLLTMFTTLTDVITMRIVRSGGVIGHVLELAATVVSRASHLSTETVMQVIGCSFKLIYQLYHRGDTEEDSSIIPHKKCLKLVDDTLMFLRDQEEVSDEAMARHHEIIRMQDLIVLSKQRSALRSLVNHTLTRVIENIDVPDNLPDELPTTNTGLTYDADFVLTVVGRSAVTTAEFGSFVESYLSKQDVTELLPAAYRVLRAIATMAPNQDKKVRRGDKSAIKATLHNLSHRLARAVTAEESDEELTPQYLTARVEELLVKFNKAA